MHTHTHIYIYIRYLPAFFGSAMREPQYIYIYIYIVHRLSVDSIIPSITPVDILDQFFLNQWTFACSAAMHA